MTGQVARTREEFAKLESRWTELAKTGGARTPFQSFPWVEQWLRYRGADVIPLVFVLQEGETIAPFGTVTRGGVRLLRLLGTPDSDYPGLLTTRPIEEAWDAAVRALRVWAGSFDLVHLHSVRERQLIVAALARHLGGGGRERPYEACLWLPTQLPWEVVCANRGSGLRNELKRWDKRMRELGELAVERARTPLREGLLFELEEVERASWKWDQGNAAFRFGPYRDFLGAILHDPRMDLDVWLLRVSGRLAAFAIVLADCQRWYYYLASFRKDFANAGSFLLSRIIEAACASDCKVLDMLRGDHGYKRAWTELTDTVYEVAWPVNLRGRVAAMAYAVRWRAAQSHRLRSLRARLQRLSAMVA